jgi:hypothetical protein
MKTVREFLYWGPLGCVCIGLLSIVWEEAHPLDYIIVILLLESIEQSVCLPNMVLERTDAIVSGKHAPGIKVFHRQAKRIKLHGAGVVGGETTDRKETLDKVRSYQVKVHLGP